MKKENFHLNITVNASSAETMKKISMVDKWWAKKFKGSAKDIGDSFTVDFGETFVDFRISELVPDKKVVWLVTDCNLHWLNNKKEWNGTEVIFELAGDKNATAVHFTHAGLTPALECYSNCEEGWTEHVASSLVDFVNTGKGEPA